MTEVERRKKQNEMANKWFSEYKPAEMGFLNGRKCYSEKMVKEAYIEGITENGFQWHDLRKDPEDLPKCAENKQILFYVKEWYESIQQYRNHYCLGFYKKSFMNDDVKLFVEKSKGYENEHLPQTVLFWCELLSDE